MASETHYNELYRSWRENVGQIPELLGPESAARLGFDGGLRRGLRIATEAAEDAGALDAQLSADAALGRQVAKAAAALGVEPGRVVAMAGERNAVMQECQYIAEKCEQYWNEPRIGVPEIHAVLSFIHKRAHAILARLSPAPAEGEAPCPKCGREVIHEGDCPVRLQNLRRAARKPAGAGREEGA